jgi:hypothetical protein
MVRETKAQAWTIVQHSGYGYGHKEAFKAGLEVRLVEHVREIKQIVKAGGLLFESYNNALDYTYKEMYPEGHEGLVPRAPGKFLNNVFIDELRLYVPLSDPEPKEEDRVHV